MTDWFRSRPKLNIFLGFLSALIILVFVMAHKPYSLREIFTPDPADSYEEAIARIENIQAAEAEIPDISPECGSIVMTHEEKVENVIVFLHDLPAVQISLPRWVKSISIRVITS
jgi:hypothetical protein